MAKGDHKKAQDLVNTNNTQQQNIWQPMYNQLQGQNNMLSGAFNSAYGGGGQYNNLMNQYQSIFSNPFGNGVNRPTNLSRTNPNSSMFNNPNTFNLGTMFNSGPQRNIHGGFNENSGITNGDILSPKSGFNENSGQTFGDVSGGLKGFDPNVNIPPPDAISQGFKQPTIDPIDSAGKLATTNNNDYSGLTGRALVTNKNYVTDQLKAKYASLHGGAEIPGDELNKDLGYILTPDTYSDKNVRSGLSDYWMDRLFNPSAAGGSGADMGGNDTFISQGMGGGDNQTPFGTNFGYMPASWKGFGEGDWGNYGNSAITGAQGNLSRLAGDGGFSGQDIQDMRSRAISPIRSQVALGRDEIGRQRSLNGGYGPNNAAAISQMVRNSGQQMSDANVGVNASIASNRAANRLGASQALSQLGQYGAGLHANVDQFGANLGQQYDQMAQQNNQFGDQMGFNYAQLGQQGSQFDRSLSEQQNEFGQNMGFNYAGLNQNKDQFDRNLNQNQSQFDTNMGWNYDNMGNNNQMNALNSMSGLYGSNMGMLGGMLGNSNNNLLSAFGQLLNSNNGNFGNFMNSTQIPSNFQQGLGNLGSIMNMATPFISPFASMFNRQTNGMSGNNPGYYGGRYGVSGQSGADRAGGMQRYY